MTHPTQTPTSHAERRAVRRLRHDAGDRPMIVIWEVTRACALVCRHCRADAQHRRDPGELTTEQGRALLADIAGFGTPYPIVVLTGGDPFERPDLADLVRHGHSLGLHMALSPSVTPRLTPAVLTELRAAGAGAMSLSLDGASASTHDAFRGVAGVFEQTLVAAGQVREAGFRLQVNSTVTKDNVDELPALLELVLGLGVSLWSVFFLVPTGRGRLLDALEAEQVEDVLHWLHDVSDLVALKTTEAPHYRRVVIERARAESSAAPGPVLGDLYHRLAAATAPIRAGRAGAQRRPRPPIEVNSGRGFAFVDHRGDVYPSGFLPQRCGNVREGGFREVYRTSPLLRSLRDPEQLRGKCRDCEFRVVCGGSRSQAYAVHGDVLGSDPNCVHLPPAATVPAAPAMTVPAAPAATA
ncbi:MAG: TIGR04053 family radical SAM/SPASM domain-containing protein [Intrasporangium sp.]|uniref:TIGR04053 family radical SAM/SPASM domain-containing protein n=1 Tax=Intrasporangium sp. TaxID=1925024 RepID=UPI002648D568|nr:TIGR04053 family radical SAM/SPASM domain-containing protein [Intrasporangium sp.]MDN5797005.1 TIGR04053 family radical SAM/SPASM domain-containing protein [Intrasporangium sp.]